MLILSLFHAYSLALYSATFLTIFFLSQALECLTENHMLTCEEGENLLNCSILLSYETTFGDL